LLSVPTIHPHLHSFPTRRSSDLAASRLGNDDPVSNSSKGTNHDRLHPRDSFQFPVCVRTVSPLRGSTVSYVLYPALTRWANRFRPFCGMNLRNLDYSITRERSSQAR